MRAKDTHIEVDKTRQILMVVTNGKVTGVIPVSTGATGNTPVGHWRVLWKAPATSTWLGSAILYRTLTFHGGFAIHGFSPVPAYPASHGCVREPLWAADWTYTRRRSASRSTCSPERRYAGRMTGFSPRPSRRWRQASAARSSG